MLKPNRLAQLFHPTDFSHGSRVAFAHALKVALEAHSSLSILHVDRHPEAVDWSEFPAVRRMLSAWHLLPTNADRYDVANLGIQVEKLLVPGTIPQQAIAEYLTNEDTDLIVLATHRQAGLARWLHRSVAKGVALQTAAPTLFITDGQTGFVNPKSGKVNLKRILVPVVKSPWPQPTIDAVSDLASCLKCQSLMLTLLHVGSKDGLPHLSIPRQSGWMVESITRQGNPVDEILSFANMIRPDLIAMTTQGHDGFLDALRGSTTEQILHDSPCPVLAVHGRGG